MIRQTVIRRGGNYEKREFNSRIFPATPGAAKIIALQRTPANWAWSAMSSIGTAGIEIEAF
jgi:hypothetical protein